MDSPATLLAVRLLQAMKQLAATGVAAEPSAEGDDDDEALDPILKQSKEIEKRVSQPCLIFLCNCQCSSYFAAFARVALVQQGISNSAKESD